MGIIKSFELQNFRITKCSNYRDLIYRGFCWEIFKGSENVVWIRKISIYRDSNYRGFVGRFFTRDLKMLFELEKVRITEFRVRQKFFLEIFKGAENFVPISKSLN